VYTTTRREYHKDDSFQTSIDILAIDLIEGQKLWKSEDVAQGGTTRTIGIVHDEKSKYVYAGFDYKIIKLDKKKGEIQWSVEFGFSDNLDNPQLFLLGDRIAILDNRGMGVAYTLGDGENLWVRGKNFHEKKR